MRVLRHVAVVLGIGVTAYLGWHNSPFVAAIAAPTDARGSASARFGLELGGASAGGLNSVEGGNASADVVVERIGPDRIPKKHAGATKYEDVTIEFGAGVSKPMLQWMKDTLDLKYPRQNGAIVESDMNGTERGRLTFSNALLTEIGFPALDAASKDLAKMTVKFSPELTRMITAAGKQQGAGNAAVQKRWLPANFRLTIDGLDCTQVSKVDALVIKQKVTQNAVGQGRDFQKEPTALEYPNLVVTLAESRAKSFYDWHESFVVKGQNGDDKEKNGTLEYLSANTQEVLFTLTFKRLGIVKLAPEKVEANSEAVRRVKAEMYVEQMQFSYSSTF